MRLIDRISGPALVVTAEDEPVRAVGPFRHDVLKANPHITLAISRSRQALWLRSAQAPKTTTATGRERAIVEFMSALPAPSPLLSERSGLRSQCRRC